MEQKKSLKDLIIEKTFNKEEKKLLEKIKQGTISEVEIQVIARRIKSDEKRFCSCFKFTKNEREKLRAIKEEFKIKSYAGTIRFMIAFCFNNFEILHQYIKEAKNDKKTS